VVRSEEGRGQGKGFHEDKGRVGEDAEGAQCCTCDATQGKQKCEQKTHIMGGGGGVRGVYTSVKAGYSGSPHHIQALPGDKTG
jgi:hypothetical protein